jgi:xanthine dehydrogenase/oxidase
MHKKHVLTVEGLKGPVPVVLAQSHSSQCGFCTPGIVMSLYAQLRNNPLSSNHEIEDAFDGNLCRCTGYRPILDGAKQFSHCGRACDTCPEKDTCEDVDIEDAVKPTVENPLIHEFEKTVVDFPSDLLLYHQKLQNPEYYVFTKDEYRWVHPSSKQELLQVMNDHPGAKIINGNTEVGIEIRFKSQHYPVFVHTSDIHELRQVKVHTSGIRIGGITTITDLQSNLQKLVASLPKHQTRGFVSILNNIKYFAGKQIRNVSAIGGNICTASPISDLNPVLLALGATLTFESMAGTRQLHIKDFFLGYRKTAIKPNEVLTFIDVPFTEETEYASAFKQAKRRDDDIAIVNAGFLVNLTRQGDVCIVKNASLAYGGMGPTSALALKTNEFLKGKEWSLPVIEQCYSFILEDLPLTATSPGGMIEFRKALAQSFLFKFYLRVSHELSKTMPRYKIDDMELSALEEIHRPLSSGKQVYQESSTPGVVGKSVMHASALQQVKGEAVYIDDIPKFHNELYGCIVSSTQAHAIIEDIDVTSALAYPGVVDYISRKDVAEPTDHEDPNMIGPVFRDEELFATKTVHFVGQMIGLIVAESEEQARAAAKLVKIKYKPLPAVFTIEEAVEKESFFPVERKIETGEFKTGEKVELPLSTATHYVEGVARISAQEHFYLETQASIAVPSKEHDEMEIYASSQNPKETQDFVAHVLGIDFNRVVCRVKRLGGGFGGKETRSVFLSCALAVAAKKLLRPVRCMLTREEDMVMSGTRHPFMGNYKVGFTDEGKLVSVDLKVLLSDIDVRQCRVFARFIYCRARTIPDACRQRLQDPEYAFSRTFM